MTKRSKWILIAVVAVAVIVPIGVAGLLVGLAILGHKQAFQNGNETVAVLVLNQISVAQVQYYTENGNYASFDQLVEKELLDRRFAGDTPRVDGYVYVLKVTPATGSQKASFTVNADPESPDTGTRHFTIDDKNPTVRYNSNQAARAGDPQVEK